MADFKLSKYQEDILDYFKNNPGKNMLVEALAGAGKSSTIKLLTETTNTSDVYLAFNNTVAEDFRKKITNSKTKVYTMHALSFLIMNYNISNSISTTIFRGFGKNIDSKKEAKLDNLKLYKILDEIYSIEFGKKIEFEYKQFLSSNFVNLYNLIRVTMTEINDEDKIKELIHNHHLFEDFSENNFRKPDFNKIYRVVTKLNKKNWELFEKELLIDFTDMIYITYWKLKSKEWEVPYWLLFTNIYLDECLPGYVNVQCLEFDVDNRPHESHYQMEKLWKRFESGAKLPMALSLNEKTKRYEYKQITKVKKIGIRKTWGIRTLASDGVTRQDLRSTDNHPILIYHKDGIYEWVEMKKIKVGDKVVIGPGSLEDEVQYEEVIKMFPGKVEKVYDITVADNHNFVCRSDIHDHGFTVHNCQDQNNLQLNMLYFIKREKGRIVAVGDKFQSAYLFNGANSQAFNAIPKMFAPMKTFELPICYRCPVSHLEKVNKEFNIPILPRESAPKGNIKTINKKDIIKYIQPGDMVISRKNKWFSDVIISLLLNGFPVYMEDKDFVRTILKLINTKKFRTVTAFQSNLKKQIQNYTNSLTKQTKNSKKNPTEKDESEEEFQEVDSIQIDNIKFLNSICTYFLKKYPTQTSLLAFEKYIKKILSTDLTPDTIRVTSVHKAKGLEANNVFVLNEGKICYNSYSSKEQNAQERNLSYISITRAKQNLYLVREDNN